MTKADRAALAGVVLAGYKVKRFNSMGRDGKWHADIDRPTYSGWYWQRPSENRWIGSFDTMRSCVIDVKQQLGVYR